MTTKPRISIIIPHYNTVHLLRRLIRSLFREKNAHFEIVIVDDASSDEQKKILPHLIQNKKNITYHLLSKNLGPSGARAYGAKYARGDYLFFLDSDTEIVPGWYAKVIQYFKMYKNMSMIQPTQIDCYSHKMTCIGDLLTPIWIHVERINAQLFDHNKVRKIQPVFSVGGAGFAMRKSMYERVGGFDPDYRYSGEEEDLAFRVWIAGGTVHYVPDILVQIDRRHINNISLRTGSDTILYFACRNSLMTLLKNLSIQTLWYIFPLHIFFWLCVAFVRLLHGEWTKAHIIDASLRWLFINRTSIRKKRSRIAYFRKRTDGDIQSLVSYHVPFAYYVNKLLGYQK